MPEEESAPHSRHRSGFRTGPSLTTSPITQVQSGDKRWRECQCQGWDWDNDRRREKRRSIQVKTKVHARSGTSQMTRASYLSSTLDKLPVTVAFASTT